MMIGASAWGPSIKKDRVLNCWFTLFFKFTELF